jgi:hypothetical protein
MRTLILKDGKLYRPGILGSLSFVNYESNLRFYPEHNIVTADEYEKTLARTATLARHGFDH